MLSKEIVPTPVIAFSTKLYNACAIMFTASHNPAEYLGIKFIPDYAGPATDNIVKKIVENIDKPFSTSTKAKDYALISFKNEYFKELEKFIDFKKIKNTKINLNYNRLYCSGIGFFDKILKKHNIKFKSINMNYDKNFGGKMPDPKPKYMQDLIFEIKNSKNTIGLSNDGDADRFGVINENGEFVSANEIIAILFEHLVQNKNFKGKLAKTVGSSQMLDIIAEKYNIDVIETAVGFKHIGQAMRENEIIIGGEESGGLSVLGHIPEKDGIIANLLILEAIASFGKSLVSLQHELQIKIGQKFINERVDLKLSNIDEQKEIMQKIENSFDGIKKIDKKDGIKIYLNKNLTWVLVRPSGTEPILRIYFESVSQNTINDLKNKINQLLV